MTTGNRRPGALIGSSLLVAALSSACCWVPLLAVGLGFSAVGVGTVFERYRALLLALATGFLVGAIVLQRRSRRACDGDTCPPPQGWGLMLPIVGGLGVLAFAVVPKVISSTRGDEQAATTDPASNELVATYAVTVAPPYFEPSGDPLRRRSRPRRLSAARQRVRVYPFDFQEVGV